MSPFSAIELEDAALVFQKLSQVRSIPKSSKWLVTGAGGFIGSQMLNVFREFRRNGFDCEVTIMESNIRGREREWYHSEFEVLSHDVSKPWPSINGFSHIVHLASIASPVYYRKFPIETLDANYSGTKNVLNFALESGARVLLMSSSEIYGDPTAGNIPTPESYWGNVSSIGPRACYDEGKRILETLAWNFHDKHGLGVCVARPFNFYGPGMRLDDGRVLPDMFNSIVSKKDIVIYSDGTPTRSFCYISDAILGLFMMVLDDKTWNLFNIGNNRSELSITKLAQIVAAAGSYHGWSGKIRYEVPNERAFLSNNPQRRVPNTNLIYESLGWSAEIDVEKGVSRSLQHFMEIQK